MMGAAAYMRAAGLNPGVGQLRRVRILRLVEAYATEQPIPKRTELAARFGVSLDTIDRDLGTVEFAHGLDEALASRLSDVVGRVVDLHVSIMEDPEAKPGDRLAAGKWLYSRWQGAKRAAAAIRGGNEPAQAVAAESELLAQVMRETQEQREKK